MMMCNRVWPLAASLSVLVFWACGSGLEQEEDAAPSTLDTKFTPDYVIEEPGGGGEGAEGKGSGGEGDEGQGGGTDGGPQAGADGGEGAEGTPEGIEGAEGAEGGPSGCQSDDDCSGDTPFCDQSTGECFGAEEGTEGGSTNECEIPSDCRARFDCQEGKCVATTGCKEFSDQLCITQGMTCSKYRRTCIKVQCDTDTDCIAQHGENHECIYGECRRFPVSFDTPVPGGGERTPLRVGVASMDADYPMGVSMAGYGFRKGQNTPYNAALGGSDRVFERMKVKVIVLDNGESRIVLARWPLSWSTDYTNSMVSFKLQERTGENYLNRIISGSSHSHSLPARFWNLVPDAGFGAFGHDNFSWEIFDRLTTSFAAAIETAVKNLAPGKFAYGIDDNFDPSNTINSDRRGENSKFKDPRMTVIRVDDMTDTPQAVLIIFGMHGTHFDQTTLTSDAAGGVEVVAEKYLEAKFKKPVPAIFMNSNGGDISPRGDDKGHDVHGKIQLVGERAWVKAEALLDKMKPSDDVDLNIVNDRLAISYDSLGYDGSEFYDRGHCGSKADGSIPPGITKSCANSTECNGEEKCIDGKCVPACQADSDCGPGEACLNRKGPYVYGAFQCVAGSSDEDMSTKFKDGSLGCFFGVKDIAGSPVPQFMKTRLTAAQIGGLVLNTLPGEPLSKYGFDIYSAVTDKGRKSGKFQDATTVGYSQDHFFYLMQAEDWFQGGYEPTMDIWGWRFADRLALRAIALGERLANGETGDQAEVMPMWWEVEKDYKDDTVEVTETADCGAALALPKDKGMVGEMFEFAWIGGHPGIDLPHVFLERKKGASFEAVKTPGGRDYDDQWFETMNIYEGNYNDDHTWRVRWEELESFPTGTYRLRVVGRCHSGAKAIPAQANLEDYEAVSSAFEVTNTKINITNIAVEGGEIVAHLTYPSPRTNDDGKSDFASRQQMSYLLHSKENRPIFGTEVARENLEVRIKKGGGTATDLKVNGSAGRADVPYVASRKGGQEDIQAANIATTRIAVPFDGNGSYEITATDVFGNSGTAQADL